MSFHDVAPSGTRKRTVKGTPVGDAARDLLGGEPIAAAVVLEALAARLGGRATLVELRLRAEAAIGRAVVEQALRVGAVALEVRALVHDLLVPDEAEPLEALEDGARALVGAARLVGVLDAEEELAAVLA